MYSKNCENIKYQMINFDANLPDFISRSQGFLECLMYVSTDS